VPLISELPQTWIREYRELFPNRDSEIYAIRRGTFDFIFDDLAGLSPTGVLRNDINGESRVIGVIGTTAPSERKRDDTRLRGWSGRTRRTFGDAWDKGHFIAHSAGGAVVGWELNVYLQRRDLNSGWSQEGVRYRKLEERLASES